MLGYYLTSRDRQRPYQLTGNGLQKGQPGQGLRASRSLNCPADGRNGQAMAHGRTGVLTTVVSPISGFASLAQGQVLAPRQQDRDGDVGNEL
jgi:hypothetical protein